MERWGVFVSALLVGGVIALAYSTIQFTFALLNREASIGLHAGDLVAAADSTVEDEAIGLAAVNGYGDCVEHNFLLMEGSARRLQRGLYALPVGIVFLAAMAVALSLEVVLSWL